jgi:hypothetical protein
MTQPLDKPVRRRMDGTIDIDFYARRAVRFRNAAKTQTWKRLMTALHSAWPSVSRRSPRLSPETETDRSRRPI